MHQECYRELYSAGQYKSNVYVWFKCLVCVETEEDKQTKAMSSIIVPLLVTINKNMLIHRFNIPTALPKSLHYSNFACFFIHFAVVLLKFRNLIKSTYLLLEIKLTISQLLIFYFYTTVSLRQDAFFYHDLYPFSMFYISASFNFLWMEQR